MAKPKIQVLIGSTREGRLGGPIGRWFYELSSTREDVDVELVDLEEWDLPMFSSPIPPASGRYTSEIQRRWAGKVAEADGYVVVTAEYNHGYPAAIKNALDYVFAEWGYKPFAFVGYGNAGGTRSVEQLRQVVVELNAVPTRNQIAIIAPWERIADGKFDGEQHERAAGRLLDQLAWWAAALRFAREAQLGKAA